jgi:L-asparaginase II
MTDGHDRIRVFRGGAVESEHRVHVAVSDAEGRLVARVGDSARFAFFRSAAKPFQVLPLVEEGVLETFGFGGRELAVCCGSHNSEPRHVDIVRSMLERVGLGESDLECGPHLPLREEVERALLLGGTAPRSIHNNCSGKHAGMLALAVDREWPTVGYVRREHPVQRRIMEEMERWLDLPAAEIVHGVDGCAVPTFGVPLARMAASVARLARAAQVEGAPRRVVEAMVSHPAMVAGTNRLCTDLMERAGERVFAKLGAEGVYVAGLRGSGLGVALKVEDGAWRAVEVALLSVLTQLGVLDDADLDVLQEYVRPRIRNTRGDEVGRLEGAIRLEMAG